MNYEQLTANPLLHTDYYNGSHWWQKINQDWEVSHIYNRAQGQILDGFIEQVRDWFGNMKITKEMVVELDKNSKRMNKQADFPIALFMRVVDEFGGVPPIAIEALPDGTYCPAGTPFAQIRNTVKGFGELCFTPDTVVLGDNKAINSYRMGDHVITSSGLVKVNRVFSRPYKGELRRIRASGLLPIKVTPNHPFLVVSAKRVSKKHEISRVFSEPRWVEARNLKPLDRSKWTREGDYLLLPKIPSSNPITAVSLAQFSHWPNKRTRLSFPIDEKTAWFIGLYVAEGSTSFWKNKKTGEKTGRIEISLNKNEEHIFQKIKDTLIPLGYTVRKKKPTESNGMVLEVGSTVVARAFNEWCGHLAENKKIPDFILFNDSTNLKAFLKGWEEGDGSEGRVSRTVDRSYITGTTVSKVLVTQLQLAYARLDIFANISIKKAGIQRFPNGYVSKTKEAYKIDYALDRAKNRSFVSLGGYFATPIKDIAQEQYQGEVNNLETDNQQYLVSNAVTHNCTWWEPKLLRPAHMSGYSTRGYWANKYLADRGLSLARFHSFGFRGNATEEGTYWVSRAWNKFLEGTDDLVSTAWTPDNVNIESIAASAHKVIQQFDNEVDAYKFIIDAAKEHGQSVVAMPIDTYDAYRFISQYMIEVANYAKAKGLWVVFRPDSDGPNGEPIIEQALEMWKVKQANNLDNMSVIIGDKMSFKQARIDDETLTNAKIPLEWVRYGIGSGFYNDINRDWAGWSLKTAYSNYDNRMKFAVALKQSIPGAVDLFYDSTGDMYVDLRKSPIPPSTPNDGSLFRTVWAFDGSNVVANTTPDFELWNEIRERALKQNAASQPRIKITPAVQAEISRLRKKHGLDMDTAVFGPQVTSIPDVV